MYEDSYDEAKENVKKSDYARGSYYRNISGEKWGNPHNYDLCIDSSKGFDYCVDQICQLYYSLNKK